MLWTYNAVWLNHMIQHHIIHQNALINLYLQTWDDLLCICVCMCNRCIFGERKISKEAFECIRTNKFGGL